MKSHSYQQDLKSFNLNLSREPGNGVELTMFNHGDLISYSDYVGYLDETTSGIEVTDMEGNRHALEDFKEFKQRSILVEAIENTRRYHFLCYPDIPGDVMDALYRYAEGHNSLHNRLPLWKIARCGIKSGKAAQVMCRFLDFGVVVPDIVLIDKARIDQWEKLHDEICALSGLEKNALIYDRVSAQGEELLRKEASLLSGIA